MSKINYIKSLRLKNFQSHKDTYLEFNPKLNTILGPSDSGKTSIIRAMKWVLFNEPSGSAFIREGEKECSVVLELNNNYKVKRYRTASKNQYIIIDPYGKEQVLTGFGVEVPEEVVEVTGIRKVQFDKDYSEKLNLGEQLEGPFLLSEKNSTKAAAIGGLVGVEIVDSAVDNVLKDLRAYSVVEKNNIEKMEALREELEAYDGLEEEKKLLERLKTIRDSIVEKGESLDKLNKIREKRNYLNKEFVQIESILSSLKGLDQAQVNYQLLEGKVSLYRNYLNLRDRFERNILSIDYTNKELEKLEGLDQLEEISKLLYGKLNLYRDYERLFLNYKELNKNLIENKGILESLGEVDNIGSLLNKIDTKINSYRLLEESYSRLKDAEKRINIGVDYLDRFQALDKVDKGYASLEKDIDRLLILKNLRLNLRKLTKEIEASEASYKSIVDRIDKKTKDYAECLKEEKQCPYCLSEITDEKLEEIIKTYK